MEKSPEKKEMTKVEMCKRRRDGETKNVKELEIRDWSWENL